MSRTYISDRIAQLIEAKEQSGQYDVIYGHLLPRRAAFQSIPEDILNEGIQPDISLEVKGEIWRINSEKFAATQYKTMGIGITRNIDHQLCEVRLPHGWRYIATEHPMWNELYDNNNRLRAKVFYKSDWLGGRAEIHFCTRYTISVSRTCSNDASYEEYSMSPICGSVRDGSTIIYTTPLFPTTGDVYKDGRPEAQVRQHLESYMADYYPEWRDFNAYWT